MSARTVLRTPQSTNTLIAPETILPSFYAVRILHEDISRLRLVPAGVDYNGILQPERLLARVRISGDRVVPQPGAFSFERLKAMEKWRKILGQ